MTLLNSGHVRVYQWDGSAWSQGSSIVGEAALDESGYAVSLSSDGKTLAVGSPYNDGNGTNAGHARVYVWDGSDWVQRGDDLDGEGAGDEFGKSVADG